MSKELKMVKLEGISKKLDKSIRKLVEPRATAGNMQHNALEEHNY